MSVFNWVNSQAVFNRQDLKSIRQSALVHGNLLTRHYIKCIINWLLIIGRYLTDIISQASFIRRVFQGCFLLVVVNLQYFQSVSIGRYLSGGN